MTITKTIIKIKRHLYNKQTKKQPTKSWTNHQPLSTNNKPPNNNNKQTSYINIIKSRIYVANL